MRSIILRKTDKGEADELVTFFSRDCGWLTGIAKNSKKSRVRFGGNLEPYTIVDLNIRQRKRDDLVWIDDAAVLRAFTNIRLDIDSFARASYFLELASAFSAESQPDENLFDFMEGFLAQLDTAKPNISLLLLKEIELLGLLGYSPTINVCPICSRAFHSNEGGIFSVEAGGVCHATCSNNRRDQFLALSPDTLALLRRAFEMDKSLLGRFRLNQKGQSELRRALSCFVRWLRGEDFKSLRFMESALSVDPPDHESGG